ncbi:MAG: hypothetical protein IT355_09535 [Gemmatimonadaceae bacterium]|nr:hypothetical protein [Gemmatimonadaceae bacterium]
MLWKIFSWVLPIWNLVTAALLLRYVAFRPREVREREVAMWGASSDASPAGRVVAWGLVASAAATLVALLVTRNPVLATVPWAQFIANAIADRVLGRDGTRRRARQRHPAGETGPVAG